MTTAELCQELQAAQRRRASIIRTRVQVTNRLTALVASSIGYHAGMTEAERAKAWKAAEKVIKDVQNGNMEHPLATIIMQQQESELAFLKLMQRGFEKPMVQMARKLPVADWINEPEQRGVSEMYLAVIIGETGDLSNYPNPAKVWKRLGCAPFEKGGKVQMGSTWRRTGGLSGEDWESFGYSPRRRSIAFMVGANIVKANKEGSGNIYRDRYDEAKASHAEKHPDYSPMRCHLHAQLLATKLFLKNLWIEWHRVEGAATETAEEATACSY